MMAIVIEHDSDSWLPLHRRTSADRPYPNGTLSTHRSRLSALLGSPQTLQQKLCRLVMEAALRELSQLAATMETQAVAFAFRFNGALAFLHRAAQLLQRVAASLRLFLLSIYYHMHILRLKVALSQASIPT